MIHIKQLRQLIKLMKDNELTEIDLRDGQEQVTLKRGAGDHVQDLPAPAAPVLPPAAAPAPTAADASGTPPVANDREGLVEITSPMVGTFYSSPSPDAEAFVRVGSTIDANTVVCLVEAMKVFNEIKPEGVSGTIEKVLATSGEAVEFGQALFLVRPH